MATKKQKRQEALTKRAQFEETMRLEGLSLLKKEKQRKQAKELDEWRENHNKNHSWTKRIKECPHCRIETAKARHSVAV